MKIPARVRARTSFTGTGSKQFYPKKEKTWCGVGDLVRGTDLLIIMSKYLTHGGVKEKPALISMVLEANWDQ